jgi:hypothetical protein
MFGATVNITDYL